MDIYRSQYTAAQIEATIGKSPIIDEVSGEWKIYDIETGEYVTTGIMADSEIAAARAETAQDKAEDAQTAAETAQDKAEDAQTAAETAQGKAEDAKTAAETAQGKAEDAQTAAETAQDKAEDAQTAAETAQGKAEDAKTAAETAQGKAEDAQTAAETAQDKAEDALTHAPKIENGTWHVWDAAQKAYVDTGVQAQGPQGDDGFSPSATVTQVGDVTTVSITDKDGTTEAEIDLTDYDQSGVIADHVTKLPSGYREIEYAQSDGTQYMWAGNYIPDLDYRAVCRFRFLAPAAPSMTVQFIFGERHTPTVKAFCVYGNENGIFANYDDASYKLADYDNNVHTVEFAPDTVNGKMEFMLDGKKANEAVLVTSAGSRIMRLFGIYAYSSYQSASQIYFLKVWDENGVLKTDCVPCVRKSDGEVGMYDINTFRTATLSSETKLAAGGEMIMRNTYNRLEDAERNIGGILPDAPSADGTYKLTCTVASGVITYSWEAIL